MGRGFESLRAGQLIVKEKDMTWINVNDKLPEVGEKCWYFFDLVGSHRGWYEGIYVDELGGSADCIVSYLMYKYCIY